jgi:hypothetical protein
MVGVAVRPRNSRELNAAILDGLELGAKKIVDFRNSLFAAPVPTAN